MQFNDNPRVISERLESRIHKLEVQLAGTRKTLRRPHLSSRKGRACEDWVERLEQLIVELSRELQKKRSLVPA